MSVTYPDFATRQRGVGAGSNLGFGADTLSFFGDEQGFDLSGLGGPGLGTGQEPMVLLDWTPTLVWKPMYSNETDLAMRRRKPPSTQRQVAGKLPNLVPLSVGINSIYGWDEKRWKQLADRLIQSGMLPESYTQAQLFDAWEGLVRQTANFNAAGKTVTPWDVIGLMSAGPGGGGIGATPHTVVRREVRLSSPDEAEGVLRQVLSAALGRAPTGAELDNFTAQLNSAQRANPEINTSRYNAEGYLTSSTTTGGVDPGVRARHYAEQNPEYGAYQAVATYFPMLEQALESPF